jgi:O-antigen/teichoic acid export membrane protein
VKPEAGALNQAGAVADPLGQGETTTATISRGILWKLASQSTVQLFGLGVSLGVARLLAPSEYGAASLVLALAAFAVIFSDVSLGAVIVQRPSIGQAEASSLMWFSLVLGLVLTASFALLAPQLAALVGHREVESLLLGAAPIFAISTAGTVPTALLNRRMQFRVLELRTIAATVISSACALLIVLLGGGAWALVGQSLAQATVLTVLAWLGARWRPSFAASRGSLGSLAPSALYAAGSRALWTVAANIDNLLVGRYLGTAVLGIYGIAYNIVLIPLTRLATPIQEVAFPAFSALDSSAAVGRLWLRANAMLSAVLAPVMVALAVEADDFVSVVLGERWAKAGPVLRLLAIGGFLQLPIRLVSSALQARGHQRLFFALSSVTTGIFVVSFIVGLRWGAVGVAAAYAAAYGLAIPVLLVPALRKTGVEAGAFARSLGPVLAASVLMAVAMVGFHAIVPIGPLARLFSATALGVAVFAAVQLWRGRAIVADVQLLLAGLRENAPS